MPTEVRKIIEQLNEHGYRAYAVGGCVRDAVMQRIPADWDICTSALPQETLTALGEENLIENGLKHGTVTVRRQHENYEITTFRTDGAYTDHRHPEEVIFVRNLQEDLARRDFTINALAYHEQEGLIDYDGGLSDIQNRILRCVGEPDRRFHEDGLRIMRGLRFASQLGFTLEPKTAESIHRNASLLRYISAERIMTELIKLLTGRYVEQVLLEYADVLAVFLPEITPMIGYPQHNPHHVFDVWQHTAKVVSEVPEEKVLRLAALFHDMGKPEAGTVDSRGISHFHGHPEISARIAAAALRRLKSDNNTIRDVEILVKYHDLRPPAEAKYVRRLLAHTGPELFPQLIALKRADALGQNPQLIPEKLRYVEALQSLYETELQNSSAFTLKQLAVNGHDLMTIGITEGKQIGKVLQTLLDGVIDGDLPNERDALLSHVQSILSKKTE